MNINKSKGFKPFTIKAIIISMSFLYLLGPAHLEIKKFMHAVVHIFEMPNNLLSHQKRSNDIEIHQIKEHQKEVINHNHVVIDLVDKILEVADNSSELPDTIVLTHKIDKHNSNDEYDNFKKLIQITINQKECFYQTKNKICKGYLWGLKKPPRT